MELKLFFAVVWRVLKRCLGLALALSSLSACVSRGALERETQAAFERGVQSERETKTPVPQVSTAPEPDPEVEALLRQFDPYVGQDNSSLSSEPRFEDIYQSYPKQK